MKKASPCVICSLPAQCRSLFFLLTLMFPLTVGGLLGQASKRCVEIRKLVVDAVSSVSQLSVGGGFAEKSRRFARRLWPDILLGGNPSAAGCFRHFTSCYVSRSSGFTITLFAMTWSYTISAHHIPSYTVERHLLLRLSLSYDKDAAASLSYDEL